MGAARQPWVCRAGGRSISQWFSGIRIASLCPVHRGCIAMSGSGHRKRTAAVTSGHAPRPGAPSFPRSLREGWDTTTLTLRHDTGSCPLSEVREHSPQFRKRGLVAKPEDWPWSSYRHYATGERGTVEIESLWTARRRGKAEMHKQLVVLAIPPFPQTAREGWGTRQIVMDVLQDHACLTVLRRSK